MQEAAGQLGFDSALARRLAVETVLGAAQLAAQSAESIALLRQRVTSPGGTTEAALQVMHARGVADGIVAGVLAAEARGRALGLSLSQALSQEHDA